MTPGFVLGQSEKESARQPFISRLKSTPGIAESRMKKCAQVTDFFSFCCYIQVKNCAINETRPRRSLTLGDNLKSGHSFDCIKEKLNSHASDNWIWL